MKRLLGFTLLEVMVALVVVAITMGAIIETGTSSTRRTVYLKQKVIATWIAQNQVSLYRAHNTWGSLVGKSGNVDMANTEWGWKLKVTQTENTQVRKIEVEVLLVKSGDLAATATGFISKL